MPEAKYLTTRRKRKYENAGVTQTDTHTLTHRRYLAPSTYVLVEVNADIYVNACECSL